MRMIRAGVGSLLSFLLLAGGGCGAVNAAAGTGSSSAEVSATATDMTPAEALGCVARALNERDYRVSGAEMALVAEQELQSPGLGAERIARIRVNAFPQPEGAVLLRLDTETEVQMSNGTRRREVPDRWIEDDARDALADCGMRP